ncbi:anti-sigma factor antagonist [Mycolicibacterium psychrotolerans]|uniref:Anti-sigma factor antagonist n=2 Tax=Mycolicibacterium psychrotolerans TaxID=216929 RepID=A0A7I7M8B2_9MYCO|nr:anti-sigma factor antagonist [Mycolicibacterium psychrotolerans]
MIVVSDETTQADGHTALPSDRLFALDAIPMDGVVVLAARGEVDLTTAPVLADAIASHLAAAPYGLIVDLSNVDFLASAGMTVLLEGHQSARRSEKRFGVVADGRGTSRPMKLMGLDRELSLHATLSDALSDFR